jgi:hypothetical protein
MSDEELCGSSVDELAKLPLSSLALLHKRALAREADEKKTVSILSLAIAIKSGIQNPVDPGTSNVKFDDGTIKVTVPKKVSWDQDVLKAAVKTLRDEWAEDPDEYVETKLSVPEGRYNAWPASIKSLFDPARTLDVGKPKYEIQEN